VPPAEQAEILECMIDDRPRADRLLVAQLTGEARHHARWRELTAAEEAAAVTALRELAGGRADLLAEVAGIMEGASEGEPHEPIARQAAALCRKAGADPEAIPAWIEEGRCRRAAARMPPPSGGVHGLAPGSAEGSQQPVHVRVRPERFILDGLPRGGVVDDAVLERDLLPGRNHRDRHRRDGAAGQDAPRLLPCPLTAAQDDASRCHSWRYQR